VKILLINANPVVSRLFALCTRDEHIQLDEAEDIKEAETGKGYDLLFVDDACCQRIHGEPSGHSQKGFYLL